MEQNNELLENLDYQNGLYLGSKIIKFIENTTYKTLENALAAKIELGELYKVKLGYTLKNKDYAENLGIIAALLAASTETEIKTREL